MNPQFPERIMQTDSRPLSPHLQIYKLQWTSALSILHRITGLVLSAGMLVVTVWLVALAGGAESFEHTRAVLAHPVIIVLLIGWTLALFYHLFNGIRHLIWDAGMMMDIPSARRSAWVVVGLAIVLTILVWGVLL
ncbi:MAG: succinate dehydrogenase, cytochrome b556 subunit [Pseudomonadota bacterium]